LPKPYLLHHLLEESAYAAPAAEALVDLSGSRRTLDYATIHKMASSCANALCENGAGRGDRVAIYLQKSAEEAVAVFAASMAGCVFVLANSLLLGHQVAHLLDDCEAKFLITSRRKWERIRSEVANIPSLAWVLFIDELPEDDLGDDQSRPHIAWGVLQHDGAGRERSSAIGEDLAGLLYTSGSTGKPRGVMLSHRNLLAGSRIVTEYLGIQASERILSILPFSFDYGLNQWLTSVQNRATLVLFQYRFPAEVVKVLAQESITGLAGVPLVWAGLTHHTSGLEKNKPQTLRYITNSGGAVPIPTVRALRRFLPETKIFLMYGLTEAFRATYLPPDEVDRRPNSIGKAIPETEIMVINAEGRLCLPGESGTLVQRGPTVCLGYWGQPDKACQVLRPHPLISADKGGDTVCYSGDVVRMDEEGFLYFVGRADAQIKSQGYRISPTEVEEVLMASGNVQHAAVIGLPAADAGEKVHAIVVPANAANFDTEVCLHYCAEQLPAYMTPKSLEVVSALPQTPNGKVDYQLLRAERVTQTL
jgi:acyl-CoA ligase (AMP-forming) (exosortase A-associated)